MKKTLLAALAALFLGVQAVPVSATETLTIMLDWFPNVDHLPLYVAADRDFFSEEDIRVEIVSPSETTDGLKLAATGNVDISIAYEPQTIMASARGLGLKVVGRLIGHPLTTLLYLEGKGIEKPSDLEGKRIGYTVPGMMDLLTEAFARLNGITRYSPVNVGFTIVQPLVAGKIDAVMGAYKNYETVELEHRGYKAGFFALEQWGIPDYDELIFITGAGTLARKNRAIQGFVNAIGRAVAYTGANPEEALESYFRSVPEASRDLETEAFRRTLPLYAETQAHDAARWRKFADFAYANGIVDKKVEVTSLLHVWKK